MKISLLHPLRGLKLIWKILFLVNLLFILFLVFAYLSIFFNPAHFWWIAIFGLLYPINLVANLVFVVFWLFIRKRNAFYSGFFILLGITYFLDFFALNAFPKEAPENSVKIMSYNVRLFDLYDWLGNKEAKQEIYDFLVEENPGIICFQEYYENNNPKSKNWKTTKVLTEILEAKNHHEKYTHKMSETQYFGVAIFTKFPILHKGYVPFENEETNACIFADILIGKDTIRIYNAHMGSIRFNAEDYKYFGDEDTKFKNTTGGERILARIKAAYAKRVDQTERILNHSKHSPHRAIICGDFNDIPISYTYHQFEKDLKDAFLESGFGIGKTYIGKIPSYRIDYIWLDQSIQSYQFKVHEEELSDHRAISCYIEL